VLANWVHRTGEAVHQWLVEHVVSHLPGGIARAAGVVKQRDIELP
jgi:hypothetical protein